MPLIMNLATPANHRLVLILCAVVTALLAIPLFWSAGGASPRACAELLANGGFEAGSAGWSQSSLGGYDLISDFNPRTGELGAYLGGANDADDRLSQAITLPAAAASTTLTAWWSIATDETGGAFDSLTIAVHRPDGSRLALLGTVDNTADLNLWQEFQADLQPWAGQPVVLVLEAQTDGSNPTDFYVDDVSVIACDGEPPGTTTPTTTATADGSLTPSPVPTATATPTRDPGSGVGAGFLPLVLIQS